MLVYLTVSQQLVKPNPPIHLSNALELCLASFEPHLTVAWVIEHRSVAVVDLAMVQDFESVSQGLI